MPQLIDAATGAHLWADRFEGSIERIFELQDQVTEKIVGAIGPKLQRAETERSRQKPTHSLDAYDYFLRGIASFYVVTKEGIEQAIGLFRKAIEIDPNYSSACGMIALCYVRRKASRTMADEKGETAEALQFARRAVDFGPEDAIALSTGGFGLAYLGSELDDGTTFIDRALELSPKLGLRHLFSAAGSGYCLAIRKRQSSTSSTQCDLVRSTRSSCPRIRVSLLRIFLMGAVSRSCRFGANGFPAATEILLH